MQTIYASPIGELFLIWSEAAVTGVYFERADEPFGEPNDIALLCIQQLDEYFAGKRTEFSVPLSLNGTDFRKTVWDELIKIPFGETISYGELANRLGKPKAQRAVGGANHHNPISIIVPCHRVIGSSGKLTGYGGELWRKEWLLEHEKKVIGEGKRC